MLRVVAHKSAAAALSYYTQGLQREDYYSEGQEVIGNWHGKAAQELGLSGKVAPEDFAALVENRRPGGDGKLTARMNKSERVVGCDFNFHAPKSLSLLYAFTRDEDILQAFRSAVAETMSAIEAKTETRVRKGGAQENRITGNLAWAEFIHLTARPVGGTPDPHLHIHGFVFNVTKDPEEDRWKAVKFRNLKRDAPYSEAVFHSKLTRKLVELGYGIERTSRSWEVQGISRSLIDKFSRRTAEIEKIARAKGITDPKGKDLLGASSRAGKRHGLGDDDLITEWRSRLSPEEYASIQLVASQRGLSKPKEVVTPEQAVDNACDKLFSKRSTVEFKRLVAETLRYGVGHVSEAQAIEELHRRELITKTVRGEVHCTSLAVLSEEVALIQFVRTGRSMHPRLGPKSLCFHDEALSPEQKEAVRHLLASQDQVIAVRGGAGVGKTTLMKEFHRQLQRNGKELFAFAPSAVASRETLREEGFANADTVAHLLLNKELQAKVKGKVVWIDEAGLLGVRDLWQLMKLAGKDTRIVLTGDTAQHAPVARGDAFRLLQRFSGLKIAEVSGIRRQSREEYKKVVAAFSRGDLGTGFRRLEALDAIYEVEDRQERYRQVAADYLALSSASGPPLVVSPTHAESERVTAAIRTAKREAGKLGPERPFRQFHNLQWDEVDRRQGRHYSPGLVVQFHQHAKGITRGELFRILGRNQAGQVTMYSEAGVESILPLKDAARFQVFEERHLPLARGDRLRITRNGKSDDGRRLSNGSFYSIEQIRADGKLVLNTGAVLDANHGHIAHGYCQTSHSSQSKSVRNVLVVQSRDSFVASSKEQFYVSVSRGKESLRIYTDDREGLREAVGATSSRKSGVELAGLKEKDLDSMSSKLNGRQWSDVLRERRAEEHVTTRMRDYLKARRQAPGTAEEKKGAERSKPKKASEPQVPGQVQATPTTQPTAEKVPQPTVPSGPTVPGASAGKAPKPMQPGGPVRFARTKAGMQAARTHFGMVAARVGQSMQRAKASLPARKTASTLEASAQHRARQVAADQAAAEKARVKTQTTTKTQTVATRPVVRGRSK